MPAAARGELRRLPFQSGSFRQLVLADVPFEEGDVAETKRVLTSRGTPVVATPAAVDVTERLSRQDFAVDEVRRVGRERILRAVLRQTTPLTARRLSSRRLAAFRAGRRLFGCVGRDDPRGVALEELAVADAPLPENA